MDCTEFLDRYSDFRDGLVTSPRERRCFERHLTVCASCRAFDVRVQQGVQALRAAEEIRPSPDFRWRLEQRLRRERERGAEPGPGFSARAGIAAALFLAAALSLLALEGIIERPQTAGAPALPAVPYPQPIVQAGVPFVSFQDPRAAPVTSAPYSDAPLLEPVTAGR